MNEAQHTTSCIVHLADSANFRRVTSNKHCNGLTGWCFESPNDTIHVTVTIYYEKKICELEKSCIFAID
jgi:hypothetical protein